MTEDEIILLAAKDTVVLRNGALVRDCSVEVWNTLVMSTVREIEDLGCIEFDQIIQQYEDQ